ncbi:MAG: HAMP domain-containing histidine kinase [Chlorobi bacterium]|nr:HAMP domain-containing histidine kinase [Chlorobiota bacterium]
MKKILNKIIGFRIGYSLSKWQIKLFLALAGLILVTSVMMIAQHLVNQIVEREKHTINLYADLMKSSLTNNSNADDFSFLIETIMPSIKFPVILADVEDKAQYPYDMYSINVEIDSNMSFEEQTEFFNDYIEQMGTQYPPIEVKDPSGLVLTKIYYSDSDLIYQLRWFPVLEILMVSVFVFIGYIAFSYVRRNEESKVWVGMAKEAAHQLGTPLSSLLAWIEIIKYDKDNPKLIVETVAEMENDVNRLNVIATRFSKIGSQPEKKIQNLYVIIETVCNYFEKRLPHLGRKIKIVRKLDPVVETNINIDLFQWVLENLLKNASEAIENKHGTVVLSLTTIENKIIINVSDNGKGMTSQQKRKVFHPGYTTKKRGWGLGLSLCKRIVEEYHDGKIFVKESVPGKGTVFQIELNKETS